jgi:Fur family transcriptional regulator, peroxide stress response regulator
MQTSPAQPALDEIRRVFREAGLSLTHQRVVLYRAVRGMRSHPSPESIYETVRHEIPSISLGTVYKNIHAFMEAGLVREVSPHHGTLRLESNLEEHHHLVCTRCKTIVDLEESDLEPVRLKKKKKLPRGFRVERYNVEFRGLCAACVEQQKSS